MDAYKTIKERRSIRKFKDKEVPKEIIKKCVDAARLSPTGANRQPLKFISVQKRLEDIFQYTNWAGYLDWEPTKKEMPRAYITIIKEKNKGSKIDVGIAAQSICITARNEGVGSCMLGAIDRENLEEILPVGENYDLELLIALGYPKEEPKIVEEREDIKYYKENNELSVPKKPLEDVWIKW